MAQEGQDVFNRAARAGIPPAFAAARLPDLDEHPKAILAYLAVFSQFLKPGVPLGEQLIVLVPTAQTITALVYIGYAALGLGVGRLLKTARRRTAFNRGVGSVYILAGAGLATVER